MIDPAGVSGDAAAAVASDRLDSAAASAGKTPAGQGPSAVAGRTTQMEVGADPSVPAAGAPAEELSLAAAGFTAMVDARLAGRLNPHQVVGLRWLFAAYHGEHHPDCRGGLLCDGMGLGKTMQAIALLHTLVTSGSVCSALIVTPKSLVLNWERELARWVGPGQVQQPLRVRTLGDGAQAHTVAAAFDRLLHATPAAPVVVLVSYEKLERQIAASTADGLRVGLLICDEAHLRKNPDSDATRAVAQVDAEARVLLTATPFQNDYFELHALVDLVAPGCSRSPALILACPLSLSSMPVASDHRLWGSRADFAASVVQPLLAGSAADSGTLERTIAAAAQADLRARLARVMLRRSRREVQTQAPTPHVFTVLAVTSGRCADVTEAAR